MPYKDPQKQKEAQQRHYVKNKSRFKRRNYEAKQKRQEIIRSMMTPCAMCGEYDPAIMDWHHVDPESKTGSVSDLAKRHPIQVALDEIEKCICLCSNCHRRLHFYNLGPPE